MGPHALPVGRGGGRDNPCENEGKAETAVREHATHAVGTRVCLLPSDLPIRSEGKVGVVTEQGQIGWHKVTLEDGTKVNARGRDLLALPPVGAGGEPADDAAGFAAMDTVEIDGFILEKNSAAQSEFKFVAKDKSGFYVQFKKNGKVTRWSTKYPTAEAAALACVSASAPVPHLPAEAGDCNFSGPQSRSLSVCTDEPVDV